MITGNRNDLFLSYLRITEKENAERSAAMVKSKQTPEQKTSDYLASSDTYRNNAANGKYLEK
jgi:hypothetical protein